MFNNKKGVTGISTALIIITVFVSLGTLLPFIQQDLNDPNISSALTTGLTQEVSQDSGDLTSVSALEIVKSVAKMFVWSFGSIPPLIDAVIFIPMRIALVLILVQYLPFVG